MKIKRYYYSHGCQVHNYGYSEDERRCSCRFLSESEVAEMSGSALDYVRVETEEVEDERIR